MGRKYTVDDLGAKPKRSNRLVNGTSPRVIKRRKRLAQALDLRLQGHSYHAIGQHMKCSPSGVQDLVVAALAALAPREMQQQVFEMELARLDAMQASIQLNATDGDIGSITTCLKIMEHRERLLGLFPSGSGSHPFVNVNIGSKDENANCINVRFVKCEHADDPPPPIINVTPSEPEPAPPKQPAKTDKQLVPFDQFANAWATRGKGKHDWMKG
jgi:hypothetical protein